MPDVLDIINEDEEIVTHASNEEVHQKHLLHKAVNILIIDSLGRIYLKNLLPLSGHVLSRQTYDQAAKNVFKNITGLGCPLILIGKIKINSKTENQMIAVYTAYLDEVKTSSGRFFTVEDIRHLLETQKAAPQLAESFNLYLKNN